MSTADPDRIWSERTNRRGEVLAVQDSHAKRLAELERIVAQLVKARPSVANRHEVQGANGG